MSEKHFDPDFDDRIETPEELAEWMRENDIDQFIQKAKTPFPWYFYSLKSFRAAEILASEVMKIHNKSWERIIKRTNQNVKSRELDSNEYLELIDSHCVSIVYFLLSRSIELLYKAICVQRDSNIFLKQGKNRLNFNGNGHSLKKIKEDLTLGLSEIQKDYLLLLQNYSFVGTYPIPLNAEELTSQRVLEEIKRPLHLNIITYEEVSFIYDTLMEIYIGYKPFDNLFRIDKPRKY